MGLTISYKLRSIEQNIDNIHKQVLALQKTAKDLGFMDVGEIIVLKDQECTIDIFGHSIAIILNLFLQNIIFHNKS
jgi:hypothetical protein